MVSMCDLATVSEMGMGPLQCSDPAPLAGVSLYSLDRLVVPEFTNNRLDA